MSSGSLQLTVGSESEAAGELKSCQTHGGKSARAEVGTRAHAMCELYVVGCVGVSALRAGSGRRARWGVGVAFSSRSVDVGGVLQNDWRAALGARWSIFTQVLYLILKTKAKLLTPVSPVAVIWVFLLTVRRRGVGIVDLSSGGIRLLVGKAEIKISIQYLEEVLRKI